MQMRGESTFPSLHAASSVIGSSHLANPRFFAILCEFLFPLSLPLFLLFYPYNKYARINQYFRGHFRFTRSMVGCFIYIYINVNVYTPVRIRISRVTVTVSLQRFLISRSNEALTHKGSPLTGWDFNEDIKVVSSRGVLRAARY